MKCVGVKIERACIHSELRIARLKDDLQKPVNMCCVKRKAQIYFFLYYSFNTHMLAFFLK